MHETTRHLSRRHHEQGFSLLEVLIVLGIVTVLSGIGMMSVKDTLDRARAAKTVTDMLVVSKAMEAYMVENSEIPESDGVGPVSEIRHLLVPQYTNNLPTHDAWGNEIFYEQILASGKNDNKHGGAGHQESWTICHLTHSPSNPSETITVAQPSILQAHLQHGDSIGECTDEAVQEEDESEGTMHVYRVYSFGRDGSPDSDVVTGLYYGSNSDIVVENGMLVQWKF